MDPLFIINPPQGASQQKVAWQPGSANFLTVYGGNVVSIFDRTGQIVDKIALGGLCQQAAWDSEGDTLAVIYGTSTILLWNAASKRNQFLEIGLKDVPTFITWAVHQALLAIGTEKGNLLLYSVRTGRKIPVLGKHNRRISCGVWSGDELLALGSDDKTLSLSSIDGDTLHTLSLRAQPSFIKFTKVKFSDSKSKHANTLSLVVGRKTLLLLSLDDYDNPQELAFQQKYGMIIGYEWFENGNIGVGFSNGYFIAISTHPNHAGQELFQTREFMSMMSEIVFSKSLNRIALVGDDCVKFHDCQSLKLPLKPITVSAEAFEFVDWSEDGQIIAVSSSESGKVYGFTTKLPNLCAAYGTYLLVLTGFKKLQLQNKAEDANTSHFVVDTEPDFLHIGPSYLGFGAGSKVWYYFYEDSQITLVNERTYSNTVTDVATNFEYAAVLCSNKVQLHKVEDAEAIEIQVYPDDDYINYAVVAHALSGNCLIYSLENGVIQFFSLQDSVCVFTINHRCRVEEISVHANGYLTCFQDSNGDTFFHDLVTSNITKVSYNNVDSLLWDADYTGRVVFVTILGKLASYYSYQDDGMDAPYILELGEQEVDDIFPLHLLAGQLFLCEEGGKVTTILAPYHSSKLKKAKKDIRERLKILKNLGQFSQALTLCAESNLSDEIKEIGERALKTFDFESATVAFRMVGDVKTSLSIQELVDIEDCFLLQGHVSMLLSNFDLAETFFLQSDPLHALRMRVALQQWDRALRLAQQYSTGDVAYISYELAKQLEFHERYSESKSYYEQALQIELPEGIRNKCMAGFARSLIHCGDFQQGIKIAEKVSSERLIEEVAKLLEEMKQLQDACKFYEKARNWDKAAYLCIQLKQWPKLKELIKKALSPKIHAFYAKTLEHEKDYKNAAEHYIKSGDYVSAIKIFLDHVNNPESAIAIYEEHKNSEAAFHIAEYFSKLGDLKSAVQYLVAAGRRKEAFELARKANTLYLLNELTEGDGTTEDFIELAKYFEESNNVLEAGRYYAKAGETEKALSVLLTDLTNMSLVEEAVKIAIGQESTNLIDRMINIVQEKPECLQFLPELYAAKGMHIEAASIAAKLAAEEQRNGRHKMARAAILQSIKRLRQHGLSIPVDLIRSLELVHSYLLVRIHVQRGNHLGAAHMLLRVSNSLSKFHAHAVQILTTAVLECQRAGLRRSAYQLAALLLNPKTRDQIDPKYRTKVENVARKPPRSSSDEETEATTPCPHCDSPCFITSLSCDGCKNLIPMCIASGYHVISEDLTVCPSCQFLATKSKFLEIIEENQLCPLCETDLTRERLKDIDFRNFTY